MNINIFGVLAVIAGICCFVPVVLDMVSHPDLIWEKPSPRFKRLLIAGALLAAIGMLLIFISSVV